MLLLKHIHLSVLLAIVIPVESVVTEFEVATIVFILRIGLSTCNSTLLHCTYKIQPYCTYKILIWILL